MPTPSSRISSEIRRWYDEFSRLVESKKLARIEPRLTDDFTASPPNGSRGSRAQWLRQMASEFKRFEYVDVNFKVEKIRANGAEAIVYLTKKLITTSRKGHRFDSVVASREVLMRNGRRWRLREIDTIHRLVTIDNRSLTFRELTQEGGMMQGCGNT